MSYDLMVFDKKRTPANKQAFMVWYEEFTKWEDAVDYNETVHTSTALKAWYADMIKIFPPMNGPLAPTDEELDANPELEDKLSDYCIGTDGIYISFAWSEADLAYETVVSLAQKHDVCFFDVSGNGTILLPDKNTIQ